MTNLITFYDDTTGLADKGRTVDVYFDFSKVFKHKIPSRSPQDPDREADEAQAG